MQAQKPHTERRALRLSLNRAVREASGLGTLFGEVVAKQLGINTTDLECLDLIVMQQRVTAGELAAATGLTTGAITGVIDRLERSGFARRERDGKDRRKVFVKVAPKAMKAAGGYYASFAREMDRIAGRYSDEQLLLLIDYFTRSRDVIAREIEKLKSRTKR
jgi:DNA-binding MarR family transcriptional regulator